MGIYDREYYRKEGPSYLDSFTSHGKICKWLIIINVVAFVIQLVTRRTDIDVEPFLRQFMPRRSPFTDFFLLDVNEIIQHFQVWRLLTYAFLHDPNDVKHIIFNMLLLWWFGTELEDMYGPREFLTFYLVSAVFSALVYVGCNLAGLQDGARALGASGAVTALMILFAFHFPTRVLYLFFILPVPIWVIVALQVAEDIFGLLGAGGRESVAFAGHLGGAAFAAAYYYRNWRLLELLPDFRAWRMRRRGPALRVYRPEEERPAIPVTTAAAADVEEHLEAKLDAVLEKVARQGQASLTDGEREILLKASEVYKRRRS